jgi:hypothetical protein
LAKDFVEINPLSKEEFVKRFEGMKRKVDLNVLLWNARKVRELLGER